MTWKELCKKAEEIGCSYASFKEGEWLYKDRLTFTKDGCVFCIGTLFADQRTPDQMWVIMEALK